MIFSVIPYYTLKLLKYCILKKVGFKIQPERFLNLFLIFREKFSLVSYKLVSYKKKTCTCNVDTVKEIEVFLYSFESV